MDPRFDAVLDVLRIGVDRDVGFALQRLESTDDGDEFHPIVRRMRLASEQLFAVAVVFEQRAPAAGAWIAFAGAVGVNNDGFQFERCRCVVKPSRARVAGASAFSRCARWFHAGVMTRMPATRFIARRKYTPPAIGHQRSPAFSKNANRCSHLSVENGGT